MAEWGSHARHDRFAVAAAIDGGPLPDTLGTCLACGVLHADLSAIRAAMRGAWIPARPRDLSLLPADAARLRKAGRWRRMMDAVGSSQDAVTRPLALSLTGLGLAGVLLTAVPVGSFGAATAEASPVDRQTVSVEGAAPSPADTLEPVAAATAASEGDAPLTLLSVGLLGAGGLLFAVHRRSPRAGRSMP